MSRLQERIAQFRKMATDDPDNELGHYRLGQLLMEDKQYDGDHQIPAPYPGTESRVLEGLPAPGPVSHGQQQASQGAASVPNGFSHRRSENAARYYGRLRCRTWSRGPRRCPAQE